MEKHRMWLRKRVEDGVPYRSVVLKFTRAFLREFCHQNSSDGGSAEDSYLKNKSALSDSRCQMPVE